MILGLRGDGVVFDNLPLYFDSDVVACNGRNGSVFSWSTSILV